MCGITGIYIYKSQDINDKDFDIFVDSLSHRGPDGRGVYKDKDVFLRLGHRRLSILDLSENGKQPMSYLNGRYWITFNGEIYNFIELRNELIEKGFRFQTDSDTEVILASYIHWKEECQLKFNGMWSFAIWDSKEKNLFLSRDRFGVKPLLYYLDNECFAFASEMKSFIYLKKLNVSFDEQMIANNLVNSNIWSATENSLFKEVKNLNAGHYAIFNKEKKLVIKRWWNTLDHLVDVPSSYSQIIEKFKELFFDACLIRMRSDVPVASALSGGLDSSSVVCSIFKIVSDQKYNKDRLPKDWQRVFTATFPKTSQDEFIYAKSVVDHTKAKAYYYEINETQAIENIENVIYSFESIFDPPVGPWLIYREFRNNNHVISIDGHGSDELLGGYHQHPEALMLNAIKNNQIFEFHKMYKLLSSLYVTKNSYNYWTILKDLARNKSKNYDLLYHLYKKMRDKVFKIKNFGLSRNNVIPQSTSDWLHIEPKYYDLEKHLEKDDGYQKLDFLTKILYKDFHFNTLPVILRNFDRSAMANGVEIRAPFLDWRIVSYIFSLNQDYKINKGFTKLLLRDAMKNILPENIRIRKTKIGFANPICEWFGKGLKSFVLDNVGSQSFLKSPIWKGEKIKAYVENCYQTKNYRGIYNFWLCIVANKLMDSFQRHRTNNNFY